MLGLFVLVLGLTLQGKGNSVISGLALIALAAIFLNAIYSYGIETFYSIVFYAIDNFGSFFKILFLTLSILVILSAKRLYSRAWQACC